MNEKPQKYYRTELSGPRVTAVDILARHLRDDDSVYAEELRESYDAAQRALDALKEGGWICVCLKAELEAAHDRAVQAAASSDAVPRGPAGDRGQVGWMGGEFER